jgi:hypothetical protein
MTLPSAQELRAAGKHEQARELLVSLARRFPVDAVVQYEAACVHDFLVPKRLSFDVFCKDFSVRQP